MKTPELPDFLTKVTPIKRRKNTTTLELEFKRADWWLTCQALRLTAGITGQLSFVRLAKNIEQELLDGEGV